MCVYICVKLINSIQFSKSSLMIIIVAISISWWKTLKPSLKYAVLNDIQTMYDISYLNSNWV